MNNCYRDFKHAVNIAALLMVSFSGNALANSPPTDMELSPSTISAGDTASSPIVGLITVTDPDPNEFHHVQLSPTSMQSDNGSCSSDADNSSFHVFFHDAVPFGYVAQAVTALSPGDYQICVWTHDSMEASYKETFTITVTADVAEQDLNASGTSDLFFYNDTTGASQNWLMLNHSRDSVTYNSIFSNLGFSPLALGDMDGDGDADIFWRNTATGQNTVWLMQNGARDSVVYMNAFSSVGWEFKALADFDGDGDADIFWRNDATGQTRIWTVVDGDLDQQVFTLSANATLSFKTVGDYNADGISDVIWQKSDGATQVWLFDNTANRSSVSYLPYMNTLFEIKGSGDFDGDGDDDLLIRNESSGQNAIWEMSGGSRNSQININSLTAAGFTFEGSGDYDGDGDSDIFWQKSSTGQNRIWEMQGGGLTQQHYPLSASTSLTLIGKH